MNLSQRLAHLRKEKHLTQADVAAELNISRQAISRWESGLALPSTENLKCLSKLYGVSVDYLLDAQNLNPCTERSDCTPEVEKARRHSRIKWMLALCVLIAAAVVCSILLRHVATGRTDSSTPISSMEQDNWSNTGSNTDDFSVGW